jgi:predicted transcriptional regulator
VNYSEQSLELSRRERQVVEILLRLGSATGREIQRELPDPPTYSAVRSILRILVGKRMLRKQREAGRDIYSSSVSHTKAKMHAARGFVRNFFNDSAGEAACALLGQKNVKLSPAEAERLISLIRQAREK